MILKKIKKSVFAYKESICAYALIYLFLSWLLREQASMEWFAVRVALLSAPVSFILSFSLRRIAALKDKKLSIAYLLLLGFVGMEWIVGFASPSIGFDTWQVYDMSRHVFTDFGYMNQIRQHITYTHYEMAFPPLFPILMAIVNSVLDMGVMASIYINVIFLIAIIYLTLTYGQGQRPWFTLLVLCCGICNSYTASAVKAGLTQIPGFFFLFALVIVLARKQFALREALLCSVLAGLGLMNRFDFLSVCVVTILAIPILYRRGEKCNVSERIGCWLLAVLLFAVIISPWVLYSEVRFGKFFVTDNGRRLFNIEDTRPSTYFSAEAPALTIWDNFGLWLPAFLSRMGQALVGFIKACIRASVIFEMFPFIAVWAFKNKRKAVQSVSAKICESITPGKAAACMIILAQEALIFLTGYGDARYHLPLVLLLQLLITPLFLLAVKNLFADKRILRKMSSITVLAMYVFGCGLFLVGMRDMRALGNTTGYTNQLMLSGTEKEIAEYLKEKDCKNLVVARSMASFPRFSALCGLETTIFAPSNLSSTNVACFVRDFHIDYIWSTEETTKQIFAEKLELQETPYKGLYKIVETDT